MIKHSRAVPKWAFKAGSFSATVASKVKSELWTSGQERRKRRGKGAFIISWHLTEGDLQKVTGHLGAGLDLQEISVQISGVLVDPGSGLLPASCDK